MDIYKNVKTQITKWIYGEKSKTIWYKTNIYHKLGRTTS